MNYQDINNKFMSPPLPEEEEEENMDDTIAFTMAVFLLGKVIEGRYNRLRDQITRRKWINTKIFLSFYTLKTSRPSMDNLKIISIRTSADPVDKHKAE